MTQVKEGCFYFILFFLYFLLKLRLDFRVFSYWMLQIDIDVQQMGTHSETAYLQCLFCYLHHRHFVGINLDF